MKIMLSTAFVAALTLAGGAQAATIVNGSFEGSTLDRANYALPYIEVGVGSNTIVGWDVTSGSVDYIGSYWAAQDGQRSVDLSGSSLGTLSQTINDTIAGKTYSVSFWVSKNPDGGQPERTGTFVAGGQNFQFSYGLPNDRSNMNWQLVSYVFTAAGTNTEISFSADASGGCCFGPAIDNVSITAVPEPATWAMMIGGFGLIGATARRRRTATVSYA
jgi:choice-of-anchor C domain-containing protein